MTINAKELERIDKVQNTLAMVNREGHFLALCHQELTIVTQTPDVVLAMTAITSACGRLRDCYAHLARVVENGIPDSEPR